MSDAVAIQRLKAGDIGGLETLVTRYQARATKAAFLILHDEQLAEDVVQDTFVHLYRQIRMFDTTRPFEPYLMRSVVNAALNTVKQSAAWVQVGDQDEECMEQLLAQTANSEADMITFELRQEIKSSLAQLPPRQRAVIVQRYYLEMSEQEMARVLDTPPGTVKWLLNQARARLRKLLGQKEREMKNSNLSRVFDRVAGDYVPANLHLFPGILSRIEKENRKTMTHSRRFAIAILLLIAVVAAGLMSVPGNVTAMRRLLGFLPQAGVVDLSTPIRVLAEPVSQTREGVTVTVGAAILSADKTVVTFTVENVPWSALSHDERVAGCGGTASLRLPNGETVELIGGEGSGNLSSFLYPPLPGKVNEAVFVMPCIRETLPGRAPENWELPLRFIPAPQVTAAPVIDLPSPTHSAIQEQALAGNPTIRPSAEMQPTATPRVDTAFLGIQLHLDQYIPLDDGYYLIGHTTWADGRIQDTGWMGWNMKAYDANGQELPIEPEMGSRAFASLGVNDPQPGQWVYRLYGKTFASPVTLQVASINVKLQAPVGFQFDLEHNQLSPSELQPGKNYSIEAISLDVLGVPGQITDVTYLHIGEMKGFEFHGQADAPLRSLFMQIPLGPNGGSSGGGSRAGEQPGEFFATAIVGKPLTFPLQVEILNASIEGLWQVTWEPPVGVSEGTATALPQACLTLEDWKEAINNPLALPDGLPGQVLLSRGALAPDPSLFLAKLDGSAEQGLVFGNGSLNSDGKKLVYGGPDNSFIVLDLQTNERVSLSVTAQDYGPIWSPSGQMIAFSRYGDNEGIYITNANGSEIRQIVHSEPGTNRPEVYGWSPDSKALLYSVWSPEQGKGILRLVKVANGQVHDLITTQAPGMAMISPDGEWIAYLDHVHGKMAPGLFIAKMDGSQRRLLVQLDHWGVGSPVWSPDGQWLAINVSNTDQFLADSTTALLNVDSCQIIPLPNLAGSIQSWVLP